MKVAKKRIYQSTVRQEQADATRSRIAAAAHKLLLRHGYSGMTMEAVAQEAGVAVATVYSIFRSKTGIFSDLLDIARFSDRYRELIREAMKTTDPRERIKFVARIAREVYHGEDNLLELLRGAGAVAPALARAEAQRDAIRFKGQGKMVEYLVETRTLRAGLDKQKAQDILFALTSRDLYRTLIRERNWSLDEYEQWLSATILESLTAPVRQKT